MGCLSGRAGMPARPIRDRWASIGLGLVALGLLAGAVVPGIAGILAAAMLIGTGLGLATPFPRRELAMRWPSDSAAPTS
jgi:DHA1 family tetracycline resistance protein-like MFS transporter